MHIFKLSMIISSLPPVLVFNSDHKSRQDACLDSFIQDCGLSPREESLKLQAEGLKKTFAYACGDGFSSRLMICWC